MELNHLRYFYEVAKQGGFTRAAKSLRVSQPSISKIVRLFEEREGVKLLDRGKRSVTLTEAGKVYFQSCEAVFGEIGELRKKMGEWGGEVSGDLSIGASDNLCNYVLPELLQRFSEKNRKVTLKLFSGTSTQIRDQLRRGKTDIGVFYTASREPGFRSERIGFVEFVVVCSTKSRIGRMSPLRLSSLGAEGYVGCWSEDYVQPYPTFGMLGSIGIKPTISFESNSQETQKRIVIRGEGYAVLPRFMVEAEVRARLLRIVPTPRSIGTEVYLVTRKGKTLSRAANLLAEALRSDLASLI